jgi:hypothetical protein
LFNSGLRSHNFGRSTNERMQLHASPPHGARFWTLAIHRGTMSGPNDSCTPGPQPPRGLDATEPPGGRRLRLDPGSVT